MNAKQKRFQHIESAVPTNKSVFNAQSLVNRDRVTRSMPDSTGNHENQETPLDCAAINSNGGEIKMSSGELHPRPLLRAENGVPVQVVSQGDVSLAPGMFLQVTV